MAINQLIAAGIQQPRFESPLNMMAQLSQLEAAREANALRQAQMQRLQRQEQQENELGALLASGAPLTVQSVGRFGQTGLDVLTAQRQAELAARQVEEKEQAKQEKQRLSVAQAMYATLRDPSRERFDRTFEFLKQQGLTKGIEPVFSEMMLQTPEERQQSIISFVNAVPGMQKYFQDFDKQLAETEAKRAETLYKGAQTRKTAMEIAGTLPQPVPESIRAGLAFGQLTPEQQKSVSTYRQTGVQQPPKTLTPLQEAADKKFAADINEWNFGGGVNITKNVAQIANAVRRLESGKPLTGPLIGAQPDLLLAITNPEAVDVRQQVEQIAQESLRPILGAQFTQKEGDAFVARVYNPSLKPEINAKRLKTMLLQLEKAAEQKQAMVDYANENGTLAGFKGKIPTIDDFYAVLKEEKPRERGAVGVEEQAPKKETSLKGGGTFIGFEEPRRQ